MKKLHKIVLYVVLTIVAFLILSVVTGGFWGASEMRTGSFQAYYFSKWAGKCTYFDSVGQSSRIRFPTQGPHNIRRGYTRLPEMIKALEGRGYHIEQQAVMSEKMAELADRGLPIIFREQPQAGISILDRQSRIFYQTRYPDPIYRTFDSIPRLIVATLLFIEDRDLLDSTYATKNPAIHWPRLLNSLKQYGLSKIGIHNQVQGASTLATQIEKFRHWPEGRTLSPSDKFNQMIAASLRCYQDGPDTYGKRKEIVVEYLNNAPFAAFPRYGEVNGIGEALKIWYGVNPDSVNHYLATPGLAPEQAGRYYRMAVSLMIAHRRPSYYLLAAPQALERKTDEYLRLLGTARIISDTMYAYASRVRLTLRKSFDIDQAEALIQKKPANTVRAPLLKLFKVSRLYDLDRMHCTVHTTLDAEKTMQVTRFLRSLRNPAVLDSLRLREERMLRRGDPAKVVYSFTLYEHTGAQNALRIQADSHEDPLNINEGIKLDLGSTAKLRTLISYLEIIEQLHARFAPKDSAACASTPPSVESRLSIWTRELLGRNPGLPLPAMLDSALQRVYSASPQARFFTGGGIHTFANFDDKFDGRELSVMEGFRNSVNLVSVRLMRDIVDYHICRAQRQAGIGSDSSAGISEEYLNRFIEHESGSLQSKYFRRLRRVAAEQMADTLAASIRASPKRLVSIYCSVEPSPTLAGLKAYLTRHGVNDTGSQRIERLYEQLSSPAMPLSDRGFIATIHPLKLWTAAYLAKHPQAKYLELRSQSKPYLQDVYRWLFKTDRSGARESRIRQMMEMEAFAAIHTSWTRLGYPFPELVPSLATALGTSADRPAALAELAGILQNDGVRYPQVRIGKIDFASGTPFHTVLSKTEADQGQRVLSLEVARAAKKCLYDVVENGTAVRLRQATTAEGLPLRIGGKTGTGDHRSKRITRTGQVTASRVMNRTATFTFVLGDRFFGAISALVPGEAAKDYNFTSALPVQIFRGMLPLIESLVTERPNLTNNGALPGLVEADSTTVPPPRIVPADQGIKSTPAETAPILDEDAEADTLDALLPGADTSATPEPLGRSRAMAPDSGATAARQTSAPPDRGGDSVIYPSDLPWLR